MRLLKLGIYHPGYLRGFYSRRAGLETQPYAEQHRALIDDLFGSSDFWTQALTKIGYETADTVANAEPLQKAWARERAFKFDEKAWLLAITLAQVKAFRPDVLLIADYTTFGASFIRLLRRECPGIQLVLGWCGAPYDDDSVIREWDVALSCVPELVKDFREQGIRSFHVNHAFARRVLDRIDETAEPTIDFAFVGSVVKRSLFHEEREKLLIELVERTRLQIWSDLPSNSPSLWTRLRNALAFSERAPMANSSENFADARLVSRAQPPVFGAEMFQKLHDSRVVFNNHIDISPVSASNMRLFETTGVGSCLLTDWRANISELFDPTSEILTYKSADECVEKLEYILANDDERRSIAAAGQRRTLRDHTFESRAEQIDEIVRDALNR